MKAQLICNHVVDIRLKDYDRDTPIHCKFDGWQDIAVIWMTEIHVICPYCKLSRWAGQDPMTAARIIRAHRESRPTHNVLAIWDEATESGRGKILETFSRRDLTRLVEQGNVSLVDIESVTRR